MGGYYCEEWMCFCPLCGSPRPKEKRDYRVNISIEPYEGDCREMGNTLTFEQAEVMAEYLSKRRAEVAKAMETLPLRAFKKPLKQEDLPQEEKGKSK